MNVFPVFLRVNETRRIVIIGGGDVAFAKADTLLSSGATLFVAAAEISARLKSLLEAQNMPFVQAEYDVSQLDGAALVIAATDDKALNAQIHTDAHARGILVNAVDQPELCDVIFPAIVRRGSLLVAISSSATSPVLARLVKHWIERALPWNLERLAEFAEQRRDQVKQVLSGIQSKRLFWQRVFEGPVAEEVLEGNDARADKLFNDALAEDAAKTNHAALYLIGAGPGHPDLITVKAARLLSQADVVLYDRLVAPELLTRYVRRESQKICVGKTRDLHLKSQESIDVLIARHLSAGQVVVRLKGGDPGIYAHGAEEIAVARKLGVPWQIVPGISAANGCAAYAGIPLTERGGAQSVRILTLYNETLHDDAFWESLAYAKNETLVFYMSSHHRAALCDRLLAAGLPGDVPVLAISNGTTPAHREWEAPLNEFAARFDGVEFPSPTLLIVGDVVRFRADHGWKEQVQQAVPFFPSLTEGGKHALH